MRSGGVVVKGNLRKINCMKLSSIFIRGEQIINNNTQYINIRDLLNNNCSFFLADPLLMVELIL